MQTGEKAIQIFPQIPVVPFTLVTLVFQSNTQFIPYAVWIWHGTWSRISQKIHFVLILPLKSSIVPICNSNDILDKKSWWVEANPQKVMFRVHFSILRTRGSCLMQLVLMHQESKWHWVLLELLRNFPLYSDCQYQSPALLMCVFNCFMDFVLLTLLLLLVADNVKSPLHWLLAAAAFWENLFQFIFPDPLTSHPGSFTASPNASSMHCNGHMNILEGDPPQLLIPMAL